MKKCIPTLLLALSLCLFAFPAYAAGEEGNAAIQIRDRTGLEAIAENPAGSYRLTADIDMKDAPWSPIPFSGTLDGAGHTIYNLSITQPDPEPDISVDGNQKEYETLYAAFFSRTKNAVIQDLHLLGADVNITTGGNCFASGLVGYAENVTISGCSVSGRVCLDMSDTICGVAGLVGFGYGTVTSSSADVTLTLVDSNQDIKCEQFLGAVLATGYVDVDNCNVKVRGYASVYGYVHNGGTIGMYYVHTDDTGHAGYVNNVRVDAEINFFEANEDRRAYCSPVIGEQLHWTLELEGNETLHFENNETTDYSTILLPETCENPTYTEAVTPADCESFGHTTFTCTTCGYSYDSDYVAPAHQPGEWVVEQQPMAEAAGLRVRICALCGEVVEKEAFTQALSCTLEPGSITLKPGDTIQLTAILEPEDAGAGVTFESSDETVATVDETGFVTAVAAGNALIICTAADGLSATSAINVGGGLPAWVIILLVAIVIAAAVIIVLLVLSSSRRRRRRRSANTWRSGR